MPWQPKSKPKRKPKVVRKQLADGSIKVYEYERVASVVAPRERDTIAVLVQAYQGSPEWKRLSAATQDRYVRYLRPLMRIGHTRVTDLTRRDITVIRNAINETGKPAAANAFVRATSALFAWGIENDFVEANPTMRIKSIAGGHFAAWTADAAARALDEMPEHLGRLILMALYTGQRRGDLCRLAWSNYDGARLRLTQEKTDVSLVIPVHPVLKTAMDGWERRAATILVNARGWPWKPESASKGMKEAIDRLGFPPGWNIHGLRKLAAANLAEAGCSAHEIMAITGHKTMGMVSLYTASADQERMATAAIHRLPVRKL
jgi:integrase